MGLDVNFSSALTRLHEINQMAHSSSATISGNLGLIGTQVVKFNTHLSERLFSKPTAEMFEASRAMRDTLRNLISDVLTSKADETLKNALIAKLDAGGEQSLLERKVVAKVLDELGHHKGAEDVLLKDAKAEASASSRGVLTDFDSVRIRAQVADANRIFDLRDEFADRIKDVVKKNCEAVLTSKEVGFTTGQMRTFNVMVADFAKELAMMNVSAENEHPAIDMKDLLPRFVFMARVAGGKEMSSTNDILKPFLFKVDPQDMTAIKMALKETVNGAPADCFVELARGRTRDAAMLMAHFDFMAGEDVELVNVILSKTSAFSSMTDLNPNEPLTRDKIHELLIGQPPKGDEKYDTLSRNEFKTKLIAVYEQRMTELCELNGVQNPDTNVKTLMSVVNGTFPVTVSEENAIRMRGRHAEKIHLTMNDIVVKGPGYNLELLKKEKPEDASKQLKGDLERTRYPVQISGGGIKRTVHNFGKEGIVNKNVKLTPAGKEMWNALQDNLAKLAKNAKQKQVVEYLLSQASLSLTNVFPMSAFGPSKAIPSFAVTKFEGSDTLTVHAEMEGEGGRKLSYSYSVEPDGSNNLFELDYTAPANA